MQHFTKKWIRDILQMNLNRVIHSAVPYQNLSSEWTKLESIPIDDENFTFSMMKKSIYFNSLCSIFSALNSFVWKSPKTLKKICKIFFVRNLFKCLNFLSTNEKYTKVMFHYTVSSCSTISIDNELMFYPHCCTSNINSNWFYPRVFPTISNKTVKSVHLFKNNDMSYRDWFVFTLNWWLAIESQTAI